jgi:hypothetical protein
MQCISFLLCSAVDIVRLHRKSLTIDIMLHQAKKCSFSCVVGFKKPKKRGKKKVLSFSHLFWLLYSTVRVEKITNPKL